MARALFPEERHRASPIYRMNLNRRIFLRFTTSGSESVSTRKHLEILSIPFNDYSLGFQSEEKNDERRTGEFSEMNEDCYGDGSIKIHAFPCLAFSTSGRCYHVAGSALWLSSCISRQFNFRGKNKALRVTSFSRHRLVAFALGDSRERASKPWGISDRCDRSHKVNRRC